MAGWDSILPMWHGVCYDYRRSIPSTITNFQVDHGEMGVDISSVDIDDSSSCLSLKYAKRLRSDCSHFTCSVARPVFVAPTAEKYPFCHLLFSRQNEKLRRKMVDRVACWGKNKIVATKIMQSLTANKSNKEKKLPNCLAKYSKVLGSVKKLPQEPRDDLEGGSLVVQPLAKTDTSLLLWTDGRHRSELAITALKSGEVDAINFHEQMSCKFKTDSKICQIMSTEVHASVLCGIRQRKACSVINYNSLQNNIRLLGNFQSQDELSDMDVSPYVPGEVLFITTKGKIVLRSSEIESYFFKISLGSEDDTSAAPNGWFGCKFGAHPRCVLGISTEEVYLYDVRSSCLRALHLFALPSPVLPSNDKLCQFFRHPQNEFLDFAVTDKSLLLLDERFCKQPVLKWSHLLHSSPNLGTIKLLPNLPEGIVMLSSSKGQDVAVLHFNHDDVSSLNIYSECSALKLSKPSDFVDVLIQNGTYSIQHLLGRVSLPLLGVDALASGKQPSQVTVLQMTRAGDIFSQSLSMEGGGGNTEMQNHGLDFINAENVTAMKEWVELFPKSKNARPYSTEAFQPQDTKTARRMFKALKSQRRPHSLCPSCGNNGNQIEDSDLCNACGVQITTSREMEKIFEKGQILTQDLLKEENSCHDLTAFGLTKKDWSSYTDPTSRNILNIWDRDVADPSTNQPNDLVEHAAAAAAATGLRSVPKTEPSQFSNIIKSVLQHPDLEFLHMSTISSFGSSSAVKVEDEDVEMIAPSQPFDAVMNGTVRKVSNKLKKLTSNAGF